MKKIIILAGIILIIIVAVFIGKTKEGSNSVDNFDNSSDNKTVISPSKTVDLSGQGLEKIPSYIFKQKNIEELNISNNLLTGAIQSEIGQLTKLKILNAKDNMMTGVPAEVGQLQNLEILNLANNQLTGLPNELGNLKKLKTLDLSGNQYYSKQDLEYIRARLPKTVNIIID